MYADELGCESSCLIVIINSCDNEANVFSLYINPHSCEWSERQSLHSDTIFKEKKCIEGKCLKVFRICVKHS